MWRSGSRPAPHPSPARLAPAVFSPYVASTYVIRASTLAPSPSPVPFFPTAQPGVGAVGPLLENTPVQQFVPDTQRTQCYRFTVGGSGDWTMNVSTADAGA